MHKFIFIVLLFAVASVAAQDEVRLSGRVTDSDNMALIGATVRIGNRGVSTDVEGRYAIQLATGNEYTVEFSFIGYQSVSMTAVMLPGDTGRTLDVVLLESPSILQTATVSSTKYEKPLGEVTVTLDVIRPQLIENTNATEIAQVLDKIPGLIINGEQANIRGGSGWSYGAGSRVLLLLDDIPVLQPDAGTPNWDDLPIENIAQIEVIKGAASALYGSSAMNGIVNVRTAYAGSKPETKAAVFYGRYDAPADPKLKWWSAGQSPFVSGLSIAHRQKFDKLDLVLGGYGLSQRSFNEFWEKRYGRLNGNLRYRFSDRLTASLGGNVNTGQSTEFFYFLNDSTGLYRADTTTLSTTTRNRFFIDPQVNFFDKAGNRHRLTGRYFRVDNDSDNNQSNTSSTIYGEYQFQRQFEEIGLVLTTGLVTTSMRANAPLYGDESFRVNNLAGYAQFDYSPIERLNISAGFRYERNSINSPDSILVTENDYQTSENDTEAKPVLRLGTNYRVARGTFLRASWGQGYRFPTLAEKFIRTNAGGIFVVPNPSLSSETGWSAEIGIKQGFRISNWTGFLDLSVFQSEYQDMIEFNVKADLNPSGIFAYFQADNIGNTRIRGIEAAMAGQGEIGKFTINAILGYNYLDPQFQEFDTNVEGLNILNVDEAPIAKRNAFGSTSGENVLKYRIRHSAKMDVQIARERWFGGGAWVYTSRIEAIDFYLSLVPAGIVRYWERAPRANHIIDLRFGYRISDHLKVTVLGKNLLNEEYSRRPGLLEQTRNVTFRLDANI